MVSLSLIHIFKGLVHEFYERNLRPLLVRSAANPSTCAAITSALAGDCLLYTSGLAVANALVRQPAYATGIRRRTGIQA